MASVISHNLRIFNAEQFKESVSESSNTKIYFTFGRGVPWSDDNSPDQANTSVTVFNDVWDNMVGAKSITGNDIRHVVPRYNWTANTKYSAYDHCICSLQMFKENVKFYAVTSDWNVYKCLSNNYSSNSTVMPSSISVDAPFQTSDSYIWKYMYTISHDERLRFTTNDYIPVKTLTADDNSLQWDVQQAAVPGAINSIIVTNGGINYSSSAGIIISISGNGQDADAVPVVNTTSQKIESISIINPGKNYTYADVSITGGTGGGATARAVISPPGGHGSDPLRELGGNYLILNPRLKGSEANKLPLNNEYRQISLIKDPWVYNSTNVASYSVASQLLVLSLSGVSTDYVEDEYVFQGSTLASSTFKGIVYKWDSTNNQIYLTNVVGEPSTDYLTGYTSIAKRFVNSVTSPDFELYSGQLLYIDNIKPITRSEDQLEDFRLVFKF